MVACWKFTAIAIVFGVAVQLSLVSPAPTKKLPPFVLGVCIDDGVPCLVLFSCLRLSSKYNDAFDKE